jgi:hypothetical protein
MSILEEMKLIEGVLKVKAGKVRYIRIFAHDSSSFPRLRSQVRHRLSTPELFAPVES